MSDVEGIFMVLTNRVVVMGDLYRERLPPRQRDEVFLGHGLGRSKLMETMAFVLLCVDQRNRRMLEAYLARLSAAFMALSAIGWKNSENDNALGMAYECSCRP